MRGGEASDWFALQGWQPFDFQREVWAAMAGGQSGDLSSKHFRDQIERYASGNLRDVYFYREQLEGHTERTYHPGK